MDPVKELQWHCMIYWDANTLCTIRKGYYSAVYFNRTREILLKEKNLTSVTTQIFQRNEHALCCGIDEVIELLKYGTGFWDKGSWRNCWKYLRIRARRDGDLLSAKDSVMHITGPYAYFAHLESVYLGILARRTLVATNTKKVVDAAQGKPVICFADRFDHFFNQEGDGYAAHIGGAAGVCTPAHASWWKGVPMGTIPHAFIAINSGNTVRAAEQFALHFPREPLIVLVDYENDCVKTAREVARSCKKSLWGVRIDTSSELGGVTPELVRGVRRALDSEGYEQVKIVVSGGFTSEKIRMFEMEKTPVDIYGVGSFLLKGNNDFTADIVMVDGKPQAKAGRGYKKMYEKNRSTRDD